MTAAERHGLSPRRTSTFVRGEELDLVGSEAIPLRRTHVLVRDLVLRVLDLFRSQAMAAGIDLKMECVEGVSPAFFLDGEKIAWAVSMLVATSLRHACARPNDAILERPPCISVRVGDDPNQDGLQLSVADSGPGMPPSRARWLFECNPATGHPAGLALVMVRDVVVAHRGTIDVESTVGKGTTITMHLPRV
jgi:signal transduction histidine kinase